MNEITVKKADLITRLKFNRDAHSDVYARAVEIYKTEAATLARKQIELLLEGKVKAIMVSLPVPEDHTDDYDRAIAMLEWDTGDEYTLSESDFAQYVLDDWGWRRSFTANTASYVGGR